MYTCIEHQNVGVLCHCFINMNFMNGVYDIYDQLKCVQKILHRTFGFQTCRDIGGRFFKGRFALPQHTLGCLRKAGKWHLQWPWHLPLDQQPSAVFFFPWHGIFWGMEIGLFCHLDHDCIGHLGEDDVTVKQLHTEEAGDNRPAIGPSNRHNVSSCHLMCSCFFQPK